MKLQRTLSVVIASGVLVSGAFAAGFSRDTAQQGQTISIGILGFLDESGSNVPAELGQKLTQNLQRKMVTAYKDVLPRLIAVTDRASLKVLTVEQMASLGKQNGVRFVTRGGLLSITSETTGEDVKTTVQLYADIVSAESDGVTSLRAEGTGTQRGAAPELSAVDVRSDQFRGSALDQALSAALEQLGAKIHDALTLPTASGRPAQPVEALHPEAAQAADTDAELQQLIGQAEQMLTNSGSSSTENISALSTALEGLKTALAAKASLLEKGKDTEQTDQEIAAHKGALEAALQKIAEELSAAPSSETSVVEQPSGEKKSLLGKINDFAGEALTFLQKIQEIRAALLGLRQEQSQPTDAGTAEGTPSEQPTEEVSGVVTEAGNPIEGVEVLEVETKLSTQTDSTGTFRLAGLMPGKLARLLLKKGSQSMTAQIEVLPGRANVLDIDFNSSSGGSRPPALTVLPSTVVIGPASFQTGEVKGVVLDPLGHPISRALVTLKSGGSARNTTNHRAGVLAFMSDQPQISLNSASFVQTDLATTLHAAQLSRIGRTIGATRTNSIGQYAFLNVPAGLYQVTVNHRNLTTRVTQVQVGRRQVVETNIKFSARDAVAATATSRGSLIAAAAGATLRGSVLDNDNRALSGARVSAIQGESIASVVTRSNGTFELRNLKPGPYRLMIAKVGFEGVSQQVILRSNGTEERNFKIKKQSSRLISDLLRNQPQRRIETSTTSAGGARPAESRTSVSPLVTTRTGRLVGRITNAATGRPLSGVEVSLGGQLAQTDRNGDFNLSLALGRYALNAKFKGYVTTTLTITVPSGGMRQDIAMRPEQATFQPVPITRTPSGGVMGVRKVNFEGLVVSSSGSPVAGATVTFGQSSTRTDRTGRFVINSLTPGTYEITISADGYAQYQSTVGLRPGMPPVTFKLAPLMRPPIRRRIP